MKALGLMLVGTYKMFHAHASYRGTHIRVSILAIHMERELDEFIFSCDKWDVLCACPW